MIKADRAEITWDSKRKHWQVRIQAGEEVIKRQCSDQMVGRDAADDALRSLALETAQNDGYELDRAAIEIHRS